MKLSHLDINSLVILQTLLKEKHVSNSAISLNVSQSNVSRVLQKMRVLFDDDLLVRSHHGYQLTPKAEKIQQDLQSVITGIEQLLQKHDFNPLTDNSKVKIFGLQPQIDTLIPAFVAKVRALAPKLTLDIDTVPKRHFDDLIAGQVHFVLSAHQPPSSEQNLYRMPIAKRDFRLVMSEDNPLARGPLTLERLVKAEFGQISLQGEPNFSLAQKFKQLGLIDKNTQLSTPIKITDFHSAPSIAAQSDIIFHLPTKFASNACASYRLVAREVPEALQLEFTTVYLYWHKRFHDTPLSMWLRELFKQLYDENKTTA